MSDVEQQTIDGYRIISEIAHGNTSEVLEVADAGGSTLPLCMKLLLPESLETHPEAKQVLKHEAKVGKALDHPSIVKVHKVSFTKKHSYIVMDYFRAPNIKTQIQTDRVGLHSRFRGVFEGLCLALGYMHEKGWVHKDIKPENVLANKAGEMRLIDFSLSVRAAGGLGKLMGNRSKAVQGTRTYIAPETLLKKSPTIQTDMYSLGITVFEILTGSPPFRGMSPSELLRMHVQEKAPEVSSVNPNVTPEMDRLVARLLEKKPAKRHKNMEEVYAEFRSLKVFKEDPRELDAKYQEERKKAELDALGASDRINSRRDHQRSEAGLNAPPKPASPKPKPAPPRQPQPAAGQQRQNPPAGQPAMGQGYGPQGPPPGYAPYPQYPQHPQQGYGYPPGMQPPPGYPMPQQPPGYYPGGPMPPGYAPQQPQGMPPQQPQQPHPQQPAPQPQQGPGPQQPPPQPAQPRPQQPAQPPAASSPPPQQPPPQQPAPKPPEKKEEEDLPLMEMDELPDVL